MIEWRLCELKPGFPQIVFSGIRRRVHDIVINFRARLHLCFIITMCVVHLLSPVVGDKELHVRLLSDFVNSRLS